MDDAKSAAELIADDLATYPDNSLVQTFMDGFQEFLDTPARVSCHKTAKLPFSCSQDCGKHCIKLWVNSVASAAYQPASLQSSWKCDCSLVDQRP